MSRRAVLSAAGLWGSSRLQARNGFEGLFGGQTSEDQSTPQQGVEIYSESVYTDAITADGQSGFILRICRYPEIRTAWCWGHAFHRGEVYAFSDHAMPCSSERTDLDGTEALYATRADGYRLQLERRGPRLAPTRCLARSTFLAHRGKRAKHGPGSVPIAVEAAFEPSHEPVSSLAGRSEVLGNTRATVQIGDQKLELTARGHFHEQDRSAARWMAPFCYATLRGDAYASVAIKLERGAVGFVVRGDTPEKIVGFAIAPPDAASRRAFELTLESGEKIAGIYRDTYVYSVPIYSVRRRGSVVTGQADQTALSGCVNDYLPERLSYLV